MINLTIVRSHSRSALYRNGMLQDDMNLARAAGGEPCRIYDVNVCSVATFPARLDWDSGDLVVLRPDGFAVPSGYRCLAPGETFLAGDRWLGIDGSLRSVTIVGRTVRPGGLREPLTAVAVRPVLDPDGFGLTPAGQVIATRDLSGPAIPVTVRRTDGTLVRAGDTE